MDAIKNFEENVIVYEIDKYDDPHTMSEEEIQEMNANNNNLLNTVIQEKILSDYYPCPSCAGKKRNSGITLLNDQPIEDDPSQYNYAVIVISEHGRYVGVGAIIRECRRCNKIEYWGDLETYAQVMAGTMTQITTMRTQMEAGQNIDVSDPSVMQSLFGEGCVLTDVDSSEPISMDQVEAVPVEENTETTTEGTPE
mgnify:FL=1